MPALKCNDKQAQHGISSRRQVQSNHQGEMNDAERGAGRSCCLRPERFKITLLLVCSLQDNPPWQAEQLWALRWRWRTAEAGSLIPCMAAGRCEDDAVVHVLGVLPPW
jgi:hypothetical protein